MSELGCGPPAAPSPIPAAKAGITRRSVLLGLALIPPTTFWVHQLEIVWWTSYPTSISLYFHVIFTLLVLMLANLGLRRLRPGWALQPSELLVVYVMLAISGSLAGHDQLQILVPTMGESTWYATPENRWQELFGRYLPDWLVVKDREALRGFYEGNSTLYTRAHLLAWVGPLAAWMGFVVVLFVTMLSMNVLLRRQWTERERLSYPIAQIPLEITDPRFAMWRSRLFWIGFALAAGIDTLNGLAYFFPSLPSLPTRCQTFGFTTWPWWALGGYSVAFYPFAIGLGYLLPLDLLFSSWLFYWLWKGQNLLSAVLGFSDRPGFPYVTQQSFGGYIGLCLFALWVARRHLAGVVRTALRGSRGEDAGEAFSYRLALVGVAVGGGLLVACCLALGVPLWVALLFFAIYFALSLAVTRMRAELGPPAHDLHYGGPDVMLPVIFGSAALGPQALTVFSLLWWMNRAYRSHPMPHQLEGLRIAERRGISSGGLAGVMLIACVAGVIVAFWSMLHNGYRYGMATSRVGIAAHVFGREPFDRLASWLTVPVEPSLSATVAIGVGVAFSLLLLWLRTRFLWWPLHPVGYAVSSSWSMHMLWMPMLIAWVIKLSVLRYGGLRLYRQGLPFFIGLILGEYVTGALWSLAGVILQTRVWVFWPY